MCVCVCVYMYIYNFVARPCASSTSEWSSKIPRSYSFFLLSSLLSVMSIKSEISHIKCQLLSA